MPRRHKPPESSHPHRWMVSYADFMTLLFAFFVVLYAMSVVNNQKFERMSQALVGLFDSSAAFSLPIKMTDILPPIINQTDGESYHDDDHLDIQDMQNNLQALVQENIKDLLTQPEFNLEKNNDWLQIKVQADELFRVGSSELSDAGEQIIIRIAKAFSKFKHSINIDVFSDVTVGDGLNNWQLSASQGSSIAYLLTMESILPGRLAVSAYGPYHPIATNDDDDGRAINRRVIFMIDLTGKQRDSTKIVTDQDLSAKTILEAVD
jgi:chemotaxis protein MotB